MLKRRGQFWKEVRCTNCRYLLALEMIFFGRIEIKCPKCGEYNLIRYKSKKNMNEKQFLKGGENK